MLYKPRGDIIIYILFLNHARFAIVNLNVRKSKLMAVTFLGFIDHCKNRVQGVRSNLLYVGSN